MRLFYEPVSIDIEFEEGILGLCVENPHSFRLITENIWKQENGESGDLFLTTTGKEVNWSKEICTVWTPFAVDINERKIISKVYSMLQNIVEMECSEKANLVNARIVELLDDLGAKFNFPLDFKLEIDFQQIFKAYDVKIEMESISLVERLINFIKIAHQILNINVFIFINPMQYFSEDERKTLNESIEYEHVTLLIIENNMPITFINEKWWVVDRDNCIIEV